MTQLHQQQLEQPQQQHTEQEGQEKNHQEKLVPHIDKTKTDTNTI